MSEPKEKIKLLFLCTGNACRSQIAEGWARHLKSDCLEAFSAGISPAFVNQTAVEVMAEAGVNISAQRPKHVNELIGIDFDYVITLCDNAYENCPTFPPNVRHIHKPFYDPAFMPGTNQEIMAAFRNLRDQLKDFVQKMPEILQTESTE
ncbi:MAG: arsenate reductase ArsC [Planctomycetota bacterium]|nr:MAG: arsenate reductase ArsC [Planctomycetota bacterium]